ncbi:MAG: hypothetical protein NTY65_14020 [Planctomycetota bacterium]|jgi:hypothetical protein|nr:hypothetical protein [Planctomycetota bacterium]
MARWERDPKLRRNLTWLLAAAEALALTLNFYFVFSAYLRRVMVVIMPKLPSDTTLLVVAIVATALWLAVVAVQAVLYIRGRERARMAFLIENGAMILLGAVWFIHNLTGRGEPDVYATWGGLLLPLVTLFPLLWPLMSLRPPSKAGGAGGTMP